ncbi:MAG: hypothetical protein CL666_07790 [Balneola sp.]|nr:hypothetical protein [Balneola sp.]|tara:strand:- start:31367 stop:31759 length:393 start_codon:yes stop_codon:yes gene_type:complete
MKAIITLISGFFGILFFEGFARLIITFYHRIEFSFYGISHLPSDVWVYVIFASVITSTWLTTMLVLTILKTNSKRYALLFGGIIMLWRLFEIANSHQSEPVYYFSGVISLHLLGVYLAYLAYSRQEISTD